ncbi:MAG: flavoredoxin [Armatimonadota bacterium]|nr:flavoredoxin [Armatimonadota bacterium]
MPSLPDDALVVRGGLNSVELLETGSGVTVDRLGNLNDLSVNSALDKTVAELSAGLPNRQIGITTVGAVRAAGGEVQPDPSPRRPYHCLIGGLSAHAMHDLLTPPVPNPSWVK